MLRSFISTIASQRLTGVFSVRNLGTKKVSRVTVDRQTLQSVVDVDKLESKMESAVSTLKWDFTKKLSTRITPAILDDIEVEFNQKSVPLGQLGHIAAKNPQTMFVNLASAPQAVGAAVKAIRDANLGLSPLQEGSVIRIPVPKMTKELRGQLAKAAKQRAERAKVGVRKVRQKGMSEVKKNEKNISQNYVRMAQQYIDGKASEHVDEIEKLLNAKQKELMQS